MKKLTLRELNRVSVADFQAMKKSPVVLVMDNIRSALNVGSAFRTGDAFAVEKVMLCGITAQPPHREILKTAIGATASVAWEYQEDTVHAIKALRKEGYQIVAVEQAAKSKTLEEFPFSENEKYALVFGNEVTGVAQPVMDLVDHCIEIPQFGTKHSLNISVSIGVVLWEFIRNRKPA
jgi:tRNA G18 (ribose-2'-O)-methylase SpoU